MTVSSTAQVLREYRDAAEAAHADLSRMDRLAGDGDFGDNLRDGLRRVVQRLDADLRGPANEPPLAAAAAVFLDEVGGTSGPLFGLLFSELSQAHQRHADPVVAWREGLAAGLAAIQRVGEAEPGDRTLVDALVPALEEFTVSGSLTAAARAAISGARATSSLRARRGRASYVGDHSAGVPDPGAVAVALLLLSAARVLEPDDGHTLGDISSVTAFDG